MATPLHRRPGVTVEQIRAKRQVLQEPLQSPEHVASIVTRDYGEHDPRIAPFPACSCGAPALLRAWSGSSVASGMQGARPVISASARRRSTIGRPA